MLSVDALQGERIYQIGPRPRPRNLYCAKVGREQDKYEEGERVFSSGLELRREGEEEQRRRNVRSERWDESR